MLLQYLSNIPLNASQTRLQMLLEHAFDCFLNASSKTYTLHTSPNASQTALQVSQTPLRMLPKYPLKRLSKSSSNAPSNAPNTSLYAPRTSRQTLLQMLLEHSLKMLFEHVSKWSSNASSNALRTSFCILLKLAFKCSSNTSLSPPRTLVQMFLEHVFECFFNFSSRLELCLRCCIFSSHLPTPSYLLRHA
jgi:hypothetical protein